MKTQKAVKFIFKESDTILVVYKFFFGTFIINIIRLMRFYSTSIFIGVGLELPTSVILTA